MIFTLEALAAKHGDALLLHYGDNDSPKHMVIDGGPSGTYDDYLLKRLDEIRGDRDQLRIELLMVSHLDDDHIQGVVDFTSDMVTQLDTPPDEPGQPVPAYDIQTLWYNGFDDVVGNSHEELKAAAAALSGSSVEAAHALAEALPVSVANGRKLKNNAERLNLNLNQGFPKIVWVKDPPSGDEVITRSDGLKLTVIAPNQKRIERLQTEWDKQIKALKVAKTAEARAQAAGEFAQALALSPDSSPYNLSSIVVLAEFAKMSMLLTGDALGKDIIKGLEEAGLLESGKMRVDLLKLPHHGSNRNVTLEFFQAIKADNYVISADGKYENPTVQTLEWLQEARSADDRPYTIHLTNDDTTSDYPYMKEVVEFLNKNSDARCTVSYRKADELSRWIDLADPITW